MRLDGATVLESASLDMEQIIGFDDKDLKCPNAEESSLHS